MKSEHRAYVSSFNHVDPKLYRSRIDHRAKFLELKRMSFAFRQQLRRTPRSHLELNGSIVGREQALDYVAMFDS